MLTFVALASVGLLIASLCRGMRTVNIIGQIIYYPMIFLSGGILIPLPEGMGAIQRAVPASYGVNLVQHVWGTDFNSRWGQLLPRTGGPVVDVVVLSVITILCLVIASKAFKWE
jgi:ABC-2 type transport system permease protein